MDKHEMITIFFPFLLTDTDVSASQFICLKQTVFHLPATIKVHDEHSLVNLQVTQVDGVRAHKVIRGKIPVVYLCHIKQPTVRRLQRKSQWGTTHPSLKKPVYSLSTEFNNTTYSLLNYEYNFLIKISQTYFFHKIVNSQSIRKTNFTYQWL